MDKTKNTLVNNNFTITSKQSFNFKKISLFVLLTIILSAIYPISRFIINQAKADSDTPTISNISQTNGSSTGGTTLTISGTNLNKTYNDTSYYVQDGLQLHLDAINNTGTGHSNTATTWKNLVQNGEDCTVYGLDGNAAWSDTDLRINGINTEYVRCGVYTPANPTVEVVTKSYQSVSAGVGAHIVSSAENGGQMIRITNGLIDNAIYIAGYKYVNTTFDGSESYGKYMTISSKYSGSQQALSINGQWWRAARSGVMTYHQTVPFMVGGNPCSDGTSCDSFYNGQISSARIYNRALTDQEVTKNQAIDWYRYNAGEDPRKITLSNASGDSSCSITEIATDGSYIKCITSSHTPGTVNINYTNGVESATLPNGFTYTEPTITSISPSTGVTEGGTNITIHGSNFNTDFNDTSYYVQDGLQLHLDAINNTGAGHDNNATIWKNLVAGGENCEVYGLDGNATWSDTNLRINGVKTEYVACGTYKPANPTVEVVTKSRIPDSNTRGIIIANTENGGHDIGSINGVIYNQLHVSGGYKVIETTFDGTAAYDDYMTISSRYNGSQRSLTINGQWWRQPQTGDMTYHQTMRYLIGADPDSSGNPFNHFYDGEISSARIYNRALTDQEVVKNQAIDYYRYNAGIDPRKVTLSNADGTSDCAITEIATDGSYIKCTTSAHLAGVVDVTYTNGVETTTLASGFTYEEPYINLSVDNNNLEIDIIPNLANSDGVLSSAKHTVTLSSNLTSGVKVTASTGEPHNNLVNLTDSSKTIPSIGNGLSTGTLTNPLALSSNAWGFAIPKTGTNSTNVTNNFDDLYSNEVNSSNSVSKWAQLPNNSQTPLIIKTTQGPNTIPDNTDIYYAAKINQALQAGAYGTTVVYTARVEI